MEHAIRLKDEPGPRPRRILSLDGGGVRGLLTCAALEKLEDALRSRVREDRRAQFRLCEYFDLIGGTSTGSIIAAWLALGHSAKETRDLYFRVANKVFGSPNPLPGVNEKFDANKFRRLIDKEFSDFAVRKGFDKRHQFYLVDPVLRTHLAVVTKRIDRGSSWIVHTHPKGRFWSHNTPEWSEYFKVDKFGKDFTPNSSFPIAKVVQASASAPFYLSPIELQVARDEHGLFIDGGVSPYNNPALQLFLMTTLKWQDGERPEWAPESLPSPFGYGWDTGPDNIVLFSFGTGAWRARHEPREFKKAIAGFKALNALKTMIEDGSVHAQTWLQALSESPASANINYEVGALQGLRIVKEPLLSYARIDARLEAKPLEELLGAANYRTMLAQFPRTAEQGLMGSLRALDNSHRTNLERLFEIGSAAGERYFGDIGLANSLLR